LAASELDPPFVASHPHDRSAVGVERQGRTVGKADGALLSDLGLIDWGA